MNEAEMVHAWWMMNGKNSKLTVQMEYITAFFSFFNKSNFSSWWPSGYEMTQSTLSIILTCNIWGVTLDLCQYCDIHMFSAVGKFMWEFHEEHHDLRSKNNSWSVKISMQTLQRQTGEKNILILLWIFALKAT